MGSDFNRQHATQPYHREKSRPVHIAKSLLQGQNFVPATWVNSNCFNFCEKSLGENFFVAAADHFEEKKNS